MGLLNLFKKKSKQSDLSYLNDSSSSSLNDIPTDLNSGSTDISSLNQVVSKPSDDGLALSKGLPPLNDGLNINSSVEDLNKNNNLGNLNDLPDLNDSSLKENTNIDLTNSINGSDSLNIKSNIHHNYVNTNEDIGISKPSTINNVDLDGDWNSSKLDSSFHVPEIKVVEEKPVISVKPKQITNEPVLVKTVEKESGVTSIVKNVPFKRVEERKSEFDDLPNIKPSGSKYKHQMRDGEIFIQKRDYGKVLMALDSINSDLSNSVDLLGTVDSLRKTKDKRFNSFTSKLNDMNSYFLKIDNILFER